MGSEKKHERWRLSLLLRGRISRAGLDERVSLSIPHPASVYATRGGSKGYVSDAKYAIVVKATDSAAHHIHVMGPLVAFWHVGQDGLNTLTVSRPGHQTSETELVKKVVAHKADLKGNGKGSGLGFVWPVVRVSSPW